MNGTLTRLMEAGAPVVERMRRGYLGLIRDASFGLERLIRIFRSRRDPATTAPGAARPLCRSAAVNCHLNQHGQ